ncbi:MAG: sensor histidine kinase [Pseudobdellovibrionaceae bacterium]
MALFVAVLLFARQAFLPSEGYVTVIEIDHFVLQVLAVGLISIIAGSLWISFRTAKPLGRVIFKARSLASKKFAKQFLGEEDAYDEEPGELFELENALNRVRQKLRKRRERLTQEREEMEALMSAVADSIVSVNLEEKVMFFNSHFANHFMSKEQAQSQPRLAEILRVPEILQLFSQSLTKGRSGNATVKIHSMLDSSTKYFAVSVSPLREPSQRVVYGAIGIFHDITEVKKTEQIRIDFVGNASHELRTPLTSIKGYLETLKDDFKAGKADSAEKFLGIISRNVDRLMELVDDLLTISTLEATGGIRPELITVETLTKQALSQVEPLRSEKNQTLEVLDHVGELYADGSKVEQVLINLVSNAIKYVQPNGKIRVEWERNDAGDAILRVIDDGPGIPEEHLDRLFERFYRIDKGRSRDAGGTGLGLSIVKHIMQSHGGTAMVRSEVGEGSEFTCIFPELRSRP